MSTKDAKRVVADLDGEDQLSLKCDSCNAEIALSGTQVKQLAFEYRPIADFANTHTCNSCLKLGATAFLNGQPVEI